MGDNGKVDGVSGKAEEPQLSQLEEFKAFLRENLKDNLELADKIMHKMEDFVPMEEIIIGTKNTPKGTATFINPNLSPIMINHAFCELDDSIRAERYKRKLEAAKNASNIIPASKIPAKGGIINWARGGKRR